MFTTYLLSLSSYYCIVYNNYTLDIIPDDDDDDEIANFSVR